MKQEPVGLWKRKNHFTLGQNIPFKSHIDQHMGQHDSGPITLKEILSSEVGEW